MPMTHLNYFWNSFLKEGTWHIYIKGKKDCIIWESFMARNYSSFMHFKSTKMKYNRETYIIMFLDWSQVPISSCSYKPLYMNILTTLSTILISLLEWLLFVKQATHLSPLKIRPGWVKSHLLEGMRTIGMIKIPHLVFVPGRILKLYRVVSQQQNNGQTVPPIKCIR